MYSMSCEPFTCCSMAAATDCDTISALAPGERRGHRDLRRHHLRILRDRQARAASAPVRIMTSAITVERTGRSMKKSSMAR